MNNELRRYWRIASWEMLKRRKWRSGVEALGQSVAVKPNQTWRTGVPICVEATVVAVGQRGVEGG